MCVYVFIITIIGPTAYLRPRCVPGPTAFPASLQSWPHRVPGPTTFPAQLRALPHRALRPRRVQRPRPQQFDFAQSQA